MTGDSRAATNLVNLEERRRRGGSGPPPPGVPAELRELPLSDVWNAKLFAHQWEATTRYNHETKQWVIYEGGRWRNDITGERDRRIKRSIESIKSGDSISDLLALGKKPAEMATHYYKCLDSRAIASMEKLARSECWCTTDEFDTDPMVFNLKNGTLDLRTCKLRNHEPADMLMNQAECNFDAEAIPAKWPGLVEYWMAGDAKMVAYLRRVAGWFLTGDVRDRAFFMLYGTGANGKGTFVSTLEALLGPYAFAVGVEFFLQQRGVAQQATVEVHAAKGKRLIVVSENERNARFNVGKIKLWSSGGDTMSGRGMRENLSNYRPTHKLLLQTNHEPKLDNTPGMADRLKKIPFLVRVPEGDQMPGLKDYLRENELPGILNWILGALPTETGLHGLIDWHANGLSTPEKVRQASRDLLAAQDELKEFFEERCELDGTFECSRQDGYIAYRQWCDDNRERHPLGKKAFLAAMREQKGLGIQEKWNGKTNWSGWSGFRVGQNAQSAPLCEVCPRKATEDGRCPEHPRAKSDEVMF